MEMVSIETIEEEILDLEKRDTSYAVCATRLMPYARGSHGYTSSATTSKSLP